MIMKKGIYLLILGLCLTLSGCASVGDTLEKQMIEQAGISDDSNYQTYQTYSEEGKLTPQGYYSEEVFEAELTPDAQSADAVRISFAENNCLDVTYFADFERTIEIGAQADYFKPGDNIYATVKISKEISSSTYSFEGFRLYQFDDGKRELIDIVQLDNNGLLLAVDDTLIGMDLSIEPIGDYGSRRISLRDYYADDAGEEHNLAGTWLVDDKEITGDEVEINPVASYIISYEYDNNEYFYMSSSPECYYSNHEDGIVIFELMEPTDEGYDYSVQLQKYLSANVESNVERIVALKDGEEQIVKAGQEFNFKKLKYGDEITLTTNKAWPQLEKCRELIVISSNQTEDEQYDYVLIVPQKGGEFVFEPNEYSYEHGTIVFKCFGEVVNNTQYLAKGTPISYFAGSAENGYWLSEGNGSIIVGDEETTRAALNNICFEPEVKATVSLPQPSCGGKIRYFVNGKEIKTKSYQTASGVDIAMQFEPWPGWISNYTNGEIYRVTELDNQTVIIGGETVDMVFKEDPEHKPTLEVVLNKSVGENMNFSISASGLPTTNFQYEDNWLGSSEVVVEPTQIGTETGIQLTMGNRSLQSGTALKILVEMQDSDGNKTSYYRLVNNLAEKQEPIWVYNKSELGVSEIWYKSIKITVSVVEAEVFNLPTNPAHANVTVRLDTQEILKNGDLIEPSTEVTVTITPHSDYYVTGKNVKNDIYQSKMKFSNYQKSIEEIIAEHPVEKYVYLTLNSDDLYGSCSYTVGKEIKSGSIRLKVGEELTIKYTVTVDGYVIEGGTEVFLGIGNTSKEISKTITITNDWDGKNITKSSFGINVVKEKMGDD